MFILYATNGAAVKLPARACAPIVERNILLALGGHHVTDAELADNSVHEIAARNVTLEEDVLLVPAKVIANAAAIEMTQII